MVWLTQRRSPPEGMRGHTPEGQPALEVRIVLLLGLLATSPHACPGLKPRVAAILASTEEIANNANH
jgi:hypothetical protein